MNGITVFVALATTFVVALGTPAVAQAAPPPPCQTGQVVAQNGLQQSASGHRAVVLKFVLAPGDQPCTLTGYPGVDTGAGGPLLHAERTLSGFQGGLRTDVLPTVTVAADQPQYAVVEGVAADRNDPYHDCPTYTELLVTAPDTTETFTVPVSIDTCELQVHPMGSEW
ncbi:DUF4232 domain-containing protein [Mycolicibacterium sp. P9-64]|uniref:DUF4232 domain-containing protein n=1 Tax=Mycolicibacterium sp. P9-64 TaxID=2024612 RepID=UPI0011F04805|nr:DUF4232 domain-containing protein [Mycolicibacterium sp. P9-64]KAA0087204.1 DUF4232 domain-containing protein [Mycolicibacterium sp. P9-64]